MIVKGKVVGERGIAKFRAEKDGRIIKVKAEFPEGEPLEYSVGCPCLEPLEPVGLLLPAFEERLGKIEGVFVEEVQGKKSPKSLFERVRKFLKSKK